MTIYKRHYKACLAGLLWLFFTQTSCSKNGRSGGGNNNPGGTTVPVVYIAGAVHNGSKWVAQYWKDGTGVTLTDGTKNAKAFSVFAVGTDVYAGGYENNGNRDVATYWKNGTAVRLTNGSNDASVLSLFVSGTDIYAAGYEHAPGGSRRARYWKNGTAFAPGDINRASEARSIFVTGTDIYVAGTESNGTINFAQYWKNGMPVVLTDGTKYAEASGIFVAGSDVYVTGFETNWPYSTRAKYWKNGTSFTLPSSEFNYTWSNTIFISGTDIHVVGAENTTGWHWKNGNQFFSSPPTANVEFRSLYVKGADVYIAGNVGNIGYTVASFWKNGAETTLSSSLSLAESVFVK